MLKLWACMHEACLVLGVGIQGWTAYATPFALARAPRHVAPGAGTSYQFVKPLAKPAFVASSWDHPGEAAKPSSSEWISSTTGSIRWLTLTDARYSWRCSGMLLGLSEEHQAA